MKQRIAAGIAIRTPCINIAIMCQISTPLILPFSASASIICTIGIATVRHIIVKNRPATDKGIAKAIDVLIAFVVSALGPLNASTIIIPEATEAKAASGATAAPIFAQPSAII